MKHLTYTDKSLLVGDKVADLLTRYAALIGDQGHADTIDVHGFGADGSEVVATFVLNNGISLMAETVTTSMNEPDNSDAENYLTRAIDLIVDPPKAGADPQPWPDFVDDVEDPATTE